MQNFSAADLSLAYETVYNLPVNDLYMRLWQEVIAAYMDWNRPPVPREVFRGDGTPSFNEIAPVAD